MILRCLKTFILVLSLAYMAGCGAKKSSSIASNILERTWTEGQLSPAPKAYCTTSLPYENPITISGTANYEFRPVSIEPGEEGLLDVSDTKRPIRHAQFDVTDSSGNILQCGETDENGNFNFILPNNKKAVSLQIYSRANNLFNKANVYIAPETNTLHKIQYFFTAAADHSNILLTAEGDNTVLGGAFNILDQIHNAFDKLKSSTNNMGLSPSLIPTVDLYWEKGFNPGIYLGADFSLSFFSRVSQKVFILGGVDGDTDYADTDHFDNSIILHEYFHFLESNISRTESPGGEHNGDQLLDPRLAWSEGAAQFFQSFVTGIPTVLDTRGNSDGSTGFFLKLSIENETTDIPLAKGEGEFREFAVARLLWDMHDSEDGETAPEQFDEITGIFPNIWEALTSTINQYSFTNLSASPVSVSALTNILKIEDVILDNNEAWYKLLTSAFVPNTLTYLDDNGTEGDLTDDYVVGPDFDSFREIYGQKLELQPTPAAPEFKFKAPYITPQQNPLANHPSLGHHYYSFVAPANSIFDTELNITRVNTTTGELTVYVYEKGFENLSQYLLGPFSENETFTLTGGESGKTYIILVAIAVLPEGDNPELQYQFQGLEKGEF